jgi:hypothetical protein
LKRAKIADGKLVLAEDNHDTRAGTVVGTIEIKGRTCTLRRVGKDGTLGPAETYQVDHLGANYEPTDGPRPVYVIMVDNWKSYPALAMAWVRRMMFE